ncbi:MAG: beta-propeller fold lactonase family protein [Proteobacteria bacterium]|nr:beta-propeller fold lactonase family protein [Pseudomonadota bacterium]
MRNRDENGPARLGTSWLTTLVLSGLLGLLLGCPPGSNHEPIGQQTFASPQSNPIALSADGAFAYVANTTSNTVSIIDTAALRVVTEVRVGLEPAGVALRPDGQALFVANHVSDSVSVIDLNPASATFRQVIQTVQALNADGGTAFDEPVAVAFASNDKAYVSLSSQNDVAIVERDPGTGLYEVTGTLHITAQDPRALAVRDGLLYVAAFESNNQTELSVCPDSFSPPQCTLDLDDVVNFIVVSPNIPGADARIVRDTDVPDRDLFVYDTTSDALVDAVSGVGTLLYGLAIDSAGGVFITQTEGRNDVNGTTGDNLIDLDNRMFLNQIGRTTCTAGGCTSPTAIELEPAPPAQPAAGDELATPYGIAISDDDTTLVATAAGTSRVFTLNASTGAVRDILDLDAGVTADAGQQIPKGVALRSDGTGAPQTAYVLNTLENTVSVVDVSNPDALVHVAKIGVGNDPTPDPIRRGRIAFNNAFASSSGTFSCESCHPDGNTDQLLWRIGGACFFGACSGDDEIRSTMPVRGLKNTLPLHWDGTLGDPFGGSNGAVGNGGNGGTDCSLADGDDHDCFLDLVMGSLSGVMCDQNGSCPPGGNELSAAERDDLATFLGNVAYPPARLRRVDDSVSASALQGFSDFFVDKGVPAADDLGDLVGVTTCADMDSGCHALPLGADTNSSTLAGFDAPTMRGMNDRWLQFSIGITNAEELQEFIEPGGSFQLDIGIGFPVTINFPPSEHPYDPANGPEELVTFASTFAIFEPIYGAGPSDMFQMFEEASTGFSGAVGRQLTLDAETTGGGQLADTQALLAELEAADARGSINLRATGKLSANGGPFVGRILSYRAATSDYRDGTDSLILTSGELVAAAQAGDAVMTLTGELGRNFGSDDSRQPLLSVTSLGDGDTGNPDLPHLTGSTNMSLVGIDVRENADVLLDGQPVSATLTCTGGSFTPYCDSQTVEITLAALPANGLRLLQVQNPGGPQSDELPICVGAVAGCD